MRTGPTHPGLEALYSTTLACSSLHNRSEQACVLYVWCPVCFCIVASGVSACAIDFGVSSSLAGYQTSFFSGSIRERLSETYTVCRSDALFTVSSVHVMWWGLGRCARKKKEMEINSWSSSMLGKWPMLIKQQVAESKCNIYCGVHAPGNELMQCCWVK